MPAPGTDNAHAFQVHLSGLIDLLSRHLYSGPQVYLRELLQNASDAIQARRQHEANAGAPFTGEITVEILSTGPGQATLVFEDNGIGLTPGEVHRFLSTIGLSSKRDVLARRRGDFIGQFGIGLLSGFMVTDEIIMVTRSALPGSPAVEWRGHGDGRYQLTLLPDSPIRPGTKVYLQSRPDTLNCFDPGYVRRQLQHVGGLLPDRLELVQGESRQLLNAATPPWLRAETSPAAWRASCLDHGEKVFGQPFLDCVPLRVDAVGLTGVAYILPASPGLAARRADRVYVRQMLVTDEADRLLPDWAFFARCEINATGLNPAASREALQDDDAFQKAREGLEQNLRSYLFDLARHDPERLRALVAVHYRDIKLLAARDEEFYRLIIDWLPFETSQGQATLKTVRAAGSEVLYAPTVDAFRQMAQVAAAQSLCIVNAGYVCDQELLERLPEAFPDVTVRRLDAGTLLDHLEDVPLADQDAAGAALDHIESVLERFGCAVEIRQFDPADLAALYIQDQAARFNRDLRRTQAASDDLWAGVLDGLQGSLPTAASGDARSRLCLNWRNPVIRKLCALDHAEVRRRAIELLYVQSLLQGHYPLENRERRVLGEGLTGLIDLAVTRQP